MNHVSFADPYCPELREVSIEAGAAEGITMHGAGTVVVIQGPRFATRAESRWYRQAGWDVINMTPVPRGVPRPGARPLLRHRGAFDRLRHRRRGRPGIEPATMEAVFAVMHANVERVRALLARAIEQVPEHLACMNRFHRWYCRSAHWRNTVRDQLLPWVLHDVDLGNQALEIGPGPGLATDLLRLRVDQLTALEINPNLAGDLRRRLAGSNVHVQPGDAAAIAFPDDYFTGVVSFTMLHHVPTTDLQDQLLREVRRVLRPGGVFAGSDSRSSLAFRLAHIADAMMLVNPDAFAGRLRMVGFSDVEIRTAKRAFRFRATA